MVYRPSELANKDKESEHEDEHHNPSARVGST